MRKYETIVIVSPDLSDEDRNALFGKLKETISQKQGTLTAFDEWGVRRLAYEIKKKMRGNYIRLEYCGMGVIVADLERLLKIDDRILRYMTVLLEERFKPKPEPAEAAPAEGEVKEEQATSAEPGASDIPVSEKTEDKKPDEDKKPEDSDKDTELDKDEKETAAESKNEDEEDKIK